MARTHKIRRASESPATKLKQSILTECQAANDEFVITSVANHSDADQRSMVRSGETKTVRRLTKIEKLVKAKVLTPKQGDACERYAIMHAARYDTLGITARYGESSGGGRKSYCHGPKTPEQIAAYYDFEFARAGIEPMIRPMFEEVVLHGRPLGRLGLTFRLAARQLLARLESRGAL